MPLETFRSRETIKAAYFDGSIENALEVARLFPSKLKIEFTGADGSFLLSATNQGAFLPPHVWVYENGSGRVEWRDHEELTKKWEQIANGEIDGENKSQLDERPNTGDSKGPARIRGPKVDRKKRRRAS